MKALTLAVLASILAAGCAVSPPDNTYAFKPGTGTVEKAEWARVQIPGGTAATTPARRLVEPRWVDGYQLALRMDDGTTQVITQDSDAFHAGDRIEVTPQGRVLKLGANTTTSAPVALRAGSGTVQSVGPATASSAAGSTVATQQIAVNMDDGTTQLINVQGGTFEPGQRITVTSDGQIQR